VQILHFALVIIEVVVWSGEFFEQYFTFEVKLFRDVRHEGIEGPRHRYTIEVGEKA